MDELSWIRVVQVHRANAHRADHGRGVLEQLFLRWREKFPVLDKSELALLTLLQDQLRDAQSQVFYLILRCHSVNERRHIIRRP